MKIYIAHCHETISNVLGVLVSRRQKTSATSAKKSVMGLLSAPGRELHVYGVAQVNERPPKVVSLNLGTFAVHD